ncbi:hypothetical protein [Streptomyces sp. NPDC017086]|uniref:hypothetical protein n=1 Tax=Streptomyces sp. NPDC017086 TaxID=3364976 RepID=UPI0037BC5E15
MTHRIEPGQTYRCCKPGYEDFRIRITSVGAEMVRAVSIDGGWALLNPLPLSQLHDSPLTRAGKPRRTGYALEQQ